MQQPPIWKSNIEFLRKLNTALPCNPAVSFLAYDPKDANTDLKEGICTPCSPHNMYNNQYMDTAQMSISR